ncbi:MAG: D-sedoheptulose 7-phosphate isomerase [Nitrospirae bacterium]|uniref:Phosphoheptose isomerase n=1 Tax=Leptospirillum ferrodiazotrophum TaxID=412449 RepID=C6HVQ1_9BACT|nr:MAG: phosphoheptose isomerase [Leptospirillum ferrodiazotrophum]MCL5953456.1 D-sedoheptulose 7-phosphate isomerase [Nitrospirota bacterium]
MDSHTLSSRLEAVFRDSIRTKEEFLRTSLPLMEKATRLIVETFERGGKLLIFGNGGSSSDAAHIAGELVSRFYKNRTALPAIALGTGMPTLTSIGNDYGYEFIFAREMEAYGRPGDLAIGLSTSGNSKNVLLALEKARDIGIRTIGFGGGSGGKMKDLVEIPFIVPSPLTPRIQETHITLGHALCEMVEEILFSSKA